MNFRAAAREAPAGLDPADYVFILLDASGQVCAALGIHDGGKTPTVPVIDGAWRICGRFAGPNGAAQTVAALDDLLSGPPDSPHSQPSGTIGPAVECVVRLP